MSAMPLINLSMGLAANLLTPCEYRVEKVLTIHIFYVGYLVARKWLRLSAKRQHYMGRKPAAH